MKNRSSYAVLTRLGIIAAVLATLMLIAPAATAQSECALDGSTVKCTYVENGTDSVTSFSATDEDGDPSTWSLKEVDDHEKFAISAVGVLTFKSPPDFDKPKDGDKDNVYKVTVVADGGDRADSERKVEVEVTDVNETGTVTFTGNQQPQVGAKTTAELKDEDGPTVRLSWQWSKGPSMDGPWEDVSSTSMSYTPKAADVGSYLRATVSYTDVEYDEADTASGVTKFAVRARPAANTAPKIPAQSIEVFENKDGSIGSVTADDDDELIFRLKATTDPAVTTDSDGDGTNDNTDNDNAKFTLAASGELSLAYELDYEQQDTDTDNEGTADIDTDSVTDIDGTNDVDGDNTNDDTPNIVEYTVVVTAEDPSGAKSSGVVIVHLLNVDEAPKVTITSGGSGNGTGDEPTVDEAGTEPGQTDRQGQITAIVFSVAADPEAGVIDDDNSDEKWTLEGPDAAKFDFVSDALTSIQFKGANDADDKFRPNFEDPKDANKDNVYEVTVVVPVADSVKPGKKTVKVKVTDKEDTGELKIAARQPQVGASVSGVLTDPDGGIRDREWQWYRGGNDSTTASEMTTLEGNIKDPDNTATQTACGKTGANAPGQTVACKIDKATSPNYTTVAADGGFHVHLVVAYTDKFDSATGDGTDTARLSATPTRAVQKPPTSNAAPKFGIQDREIDGDDDAPESVTREVKENTKAVGDFKATDTADLLTFSLGGADADSFKLSGPSDENNDVSLSFKDAPDYENPSDADGDNSYEVSITAKDPSSAADTLMVTVEVEDVDDTPSITLADDSECALDGGTVKCDYEENGTGPVASLDVADDEGDATTWSLKEADDYKKFAISDAGVLTFKSSPDFDKPDDGDKDNVYKVTVVADGGDRADGERNVEVTVTDVNETGTVSFTGNQQPQVGESTKAKLEDEDGATVRLSWQWSKAASMDAADEDWEDVSSTSASYTPKAADVGSYLRATVSYTDVEYDEADTASGVTKFAVRARPTANAVPKIPAQSIEVFENTDGEIGSVTATDDDELVFSLWATGDPAVSTDTDSDDSNDDADNDNARFDITASGDLSLKAKLDYEQQDTDTASGTNITTTTTIVEYTVVVTAKDPSGAKGSGAVIVKLLNVDEPPEVTITSGGSGNGTGDEPTVAEAGTATVGGTPRQGQITAIVFGVAADPENGTIDDDNSDAKWTLEGPDASKFALSGTSLTFKGANDADDKFRPNFDDPKDANKDNVYEVTVVVPVAGSVKPGKKAVKVKVTNAEDVGKLELSEREPQVGTAVSGKLTDEDGDIKGKTWQWYRGGANTASISALEGADDCSATNVGTTDNACKIGGAESSSYSTAAADGGLWLHLVVSYKDKIAPDAEDDLVARPARVVQAVPETNAAPKFGIQDRELDGDDDAPESVARKVKENDKAVGDFSATDDDLLTFTLNGADGGKFKLSGPSGVTNDVSLSFADAPDFENPSDADGDNTYEVSITAKDPSGATDTLMVTVEVEDVDEGPSIALNAAPAFTHMVDGVPVDSALIEIWVPENSAAGTPVSGPVTADDPNEGDILTYSLGGDDAASFDLDFATGQISVGEGTMLDYESDTKSYSVTVTATDIGGLTDTVDVTIHVSDVNEAPTFAEGVVTDVTIPENSPAGTVVFELPQSSDPDGDGLSTSLGGDDGGLWEDANGELIGNFRFADGRVVVGKAAVLDYESDKKSYSITLQLTDGKDADGNDDGSYDDTLTYTITVTDVNEAPTFAADTAELSVDENSAAGTVVGAVTASDEDADDTRTYILSGSVANGSGDSNGSNGSDESNGSNGSGDSNGSNGSDESNGSNGSGDSNGSDDPVSNGSETSDSGGSDDSVSNGSDDPVSNGSNGSDESNGSNGSDESNGSNGSDESNGSNGSDESNGSDDPAPSFTIDSATGEISVAEGAMLDHEMKDSYTVVVTATDSGGLTDTIKVTIMVNDVNEAPMFAAETAELSVDENSEAGTNVGDAFMATDVDGDTLTYSLSGDDAASFAIDSASGQISVAEGTMLDYESDTTSYSVTVTASDDGDLADTIAVTITVSDVKESVCRIGGAVNSEDGDGVGLDKDCQTLLGVMDELMGDGTGTLNWSAETPISEWDGVASGIGRVYRIHLPDKGLAGTIPAGLNGLDALERLTLRDNDLTGEIPDLSDLDNLERLNLKGNMLSGSIPATLADMDSLDYLWLHSNDLTGEIPAELGNASNLRRIYLNDNMLSGAIPSELGQLPRLRYLLLNRNQLTGSIPAGLGMAKNLKQLYLHNNMLTGSIPAELGGIIDANGQSVRLLYVHNNDLSGDIPAELGALVSLVTLRLSGNSLTGCIPAAIFDAAIDAGRAGLSACAAAEDDGNGNGSGDSNGNGSDDSNGNGNGSGDSNGNGSGDSNGNGNGS